MFSFPHHSLLFGDFLSKPENNMCHFLLVKKYGSPSQGSHNIYETMGVGVVGGLEEGGWVGVCGWVVGPRLINRLYLW